MMDDSDMAFDDDAGYVAQSDKCVRTKDAI